MKRFIDRIFFRKKYRYRKTLKTVSAGMSRVRNLPMLLALIVRVVTRHVKVTHATVFLKDRQKRYFVVAASEGELKKPSGLFRLEEEGALVVWISRYKKPVVYEELKRKRGKRRKIKEQESAERASVMKEMENLKAAVCVPSFMAGKLIGFLTLGQKLSGEAYDQEDLSIFSALAKQAALAIENAQAYEELRDTRDQLIQSERLATIGKFAADMAHEIKNPLQAIKTFFEYLPSKYDDPEFREQFSQIAKGEVDRIDHYVRQLATYTNPKRPEFQSIEIQQVIDSVLTLLENDLSKREIQVRKGYSPNGLTVEVDRDQLKQVFLNLFLNAIEAMPPKQGKTNVLEVIAFPLEKVLVIKIRDTGTGIAENQLPTIFAPFFTTKEKGSGLGLSIVQNILRAHHATIDVASKLKEGTTVTIAIPRHQAGLTF